MDIGPGQEICFEVGAIYLHPFIYTAYTIDINVFAQNVTITLDYSVSTCLKIVEIFLQIMKLAPEDYFKERCVP